MKTNIQTNINSITYSNKQFYTIMVFSKPKLNKITNQYNSIASSHLITNINLQYFTVTLEQEEKFYDSLNRELAGILEETYKKSLDIIMIDEEIEFIQEIKIGELIKHDFYRHDLTYSYFFKEGGIEENYFLTNPSINQCVFMFKGVEYNDIVANFALNDIIINDGSNIDKHLLSPIQLRLARFILAITPLSGVEMSRSFHIESSLNKAWIDWTNKINQKMISDYIDNNDYK